MKNQKFLILGVAAAVIIGGGLITNNVKSNNREKAAQVMAMKKADADAAMKKTEADAAMKKTEGMAPAMLKGSYSAYSVAKLANAEKGKVVLDFTASWCPTCQEAAKNFKATTTPDGLTLLTVDYDKSTALKQKYGVTYQHTFVQVDKNGKLLKKWSGSSTYEEVLAQAV